MWLCTGIVIGLGLAWYLWTRGLIPESVNRTPVAGPSTTKPASEPALADDLPSDAPAEKSRYDFFTVLPEMEVVVPEQELSQREEAQPAGSSANGTAESNAQKYLLQVGSFRSESDADEMKARLALQGVMANVQTVTVNNATWHRVRVGPVSGARNAEELRRQLNDSGIDTLVMESP
jgi:cell division protein FtsN